MTTCKGCLCSDTSGLRDMSRHFFLGSIAERDQAGCFESLGSSLFPDWLFGDGCRQLRRGIRRH
jgi:hypothetical protein